MSSVKIWHLFCLQSHHSTSAKHQSHAFSVRSNDSLSSSSSSSQSHSNRRRRSDGCFLLFERCKPSLVFDDNRRCGTPHHMNREHGHMNHASSSVSSFHWDRRFRGIISKFPGAISILGLPYKPFLGAPSSPYRPLGPYGKLQKPTFHKL
ncbi:hypothetical protein BT69DRAFT_456053 [Atractiella rhizophila]|nr:hypothetical protein BT69DRAFT_456053 [Atractiella rhizophila]